MNIYETITNNILDSLAKGVVPWHQGWIGNGGACNYVTRKPYSLLNQMLLSGPGEYLTVKQIAELGGKMKPSGESEADLDLWAEKRWSDKPASRLEWWRTLPFEEKDQFYMRTIHSESITFFTFVDKKTAAKEDGETEEPVSFDKYPLLRFYNVINLKWIDGIDSKSSVGNLIDFQPCQEAEKVSLDYCRRTGVSIATSECYAPAYVYKTDSVIMPTPGQFESEQKYYGDLFHELSHSTGIEGRLGRYKESDNDKKSYAREELVAELSASMILGNLGMDTDEVLDNSAAYIDTWRKVLHEDSRAIVWAAGRAEKSARMILDEQVS